MAIVLTAVRIERADTLRNPHVEGLRGLVAEGRNPRPGQPFGVDQRDTLLGSHLPHGIEVGTVRIIELRSGKVSTHDRRQQHRNGPLRAGFADVAAEICGILSRRGIARGVLRLLVVVPELDEEVIPGLQCPEDPVPAPFGPERLRGAAVGGMVLDRNRCVEQRL